METEEKSKEGFSSRIIEGLKQEAIRFKRLVTMFFEDGCTIWASTTTLITLFAIVPLIAISFPIVSSFQIFADTKAMVIELIVKNMVPAASKVIIDYIEKYVESSSGVNFFGVISFIILSISLMISIEHAFNAAWKVKKSRPAAAKLTVYWTAITITPILIGFSFYISTLFPDLSGNSFFQYLYYIWGKIFPVLMMWLAFFVLFKLMPNREVKSRAAVIGSFFAAIFWEIGKRIFSFFVGHFANYQQIYGPISAVLLFLLWIEVSWLIILFCCEISYDIQHQGELKQAAFAKDKDRRKYREFFALKVIRMLIEQFKEGKGALKNSHIAKRLGASPDLIEEILQSLKDRNIIEEVRGRRNSYILARNPKLISFAEAIFSLNQDLLMVPEKGEPPDKISRALLEARKKLEELLNRKFFEIF